MDRRNTIKTLLAGTVGTGLLATGCAPAEPEAVAVDPLLQERAGQLRGMTAREKKATERAWAEDRLLSEHEMATLTALTALIIPSEPDSPGAVETGVPDFIDFMLRDDVDLGRARAWRTGLAG